MRELQGSGNQPIRNSEDYHKFSNFLNYGTALVIPKARKNDSEREMGTPDKGAYSGNR